MRLREEERLRNKVEFQLDTRHVFYLILWSIVLSGVIFYTGLFVGRQGPERPGDAVAGTPTAAGPRAADPDAPADPLLSSVTFISRLAHHPERKELGDAVLDTMAAMREDILRKSRREEQQMKKELEGKLFPAPAGRRGATERPEDPQELLARGAGISAPPSADRRLGQAPDLSALAAPPEPEAPAAPAAAAPAEAASELPAQPPPAAAQAVPGAAVPEPDGRGFAIQAKAFREKGDADIFLGYLQGQLKRSPYKAFIMPVELKGKGKWYRVRIGRFDSRLEAEKFKADFEKRLGFETLLVSL